MSYVHAFCELVTALGALATVLAHLKGVPPRLAALFARVGVASGKFAVEVKDVVP